MKDSLVWLGPLLALVATLAAASAMAVSAAWRARVKGPSSTASLTSASVLLIEQLQQRIGNLEDRVEALESEVDEYRRIHGPLPPPLPPEHRHHDQGSITMTETAARLRVITTAAVTWMVATSVALSAVAPALGDLTASPEVATWALRAAGWLTSAVVIIRRVTPVPPAARGIIPRTDVPAFGAAEIEQPSEQQGEPWPGP